LVTDISFKETAFLFFNPLFAHCIGPKYVRTRIRLTDSDIADQGWEQIPTPRKHRHDGSVLVETIAVGVCGTDVEIMEGEYPDPPVSYLVTISRGFWMEKFLVTQGDYLAVVGNNPSYFRNGMPGTNTLPKNQTSRMLRMRFGGPSQRLAD
jgi:hypothetical protein